MHEAKEGVEGVLVKAAEEFVVEILDESPLNPENAFPFSWSPPQIAHGLAIQVPNHSSQPTVLLRTDDSVNQIKRNVL